MANIAADIQFLIWYTRWQANVPDTEAFMRLWGSSLIKNAVPAQIPPPTDPALVESVDRDIDSITRHTQTANAITEWDDPFWTLCRELNIIISRRYTNRGPDFLWCIYTLLLRDRIDSWIETSYVNTIRLLQSRLPRPNNALSAHASDFILAFMRRYNHNPNLVSRVLREVLFPHTIFLT